MRTALEIGDIKVELNEPSPAEFERFTKKMMFMMLSFKKLQEWLEKFERGEAQGEDLISRAASQYEAAYQGLGAMQELVMELLRKCKSNFDEKAFGVENKEGAKNLMELITKIIALGPSEDELKNSQPGCGTSATPPTA